MYQGKCLDLYDKNLGTKVDLRFSTRRLYANTIFQGPILTCVNKRIFNVLRNLGNRIFIWDISEIVHFIHHKGIKETSVSKKKQKTFLPLLLFYMDKDRGS